MSRLVKFMIVLLAIAVATPVLAEDRLSLNGQMRVRGWHADVDKNILTGDSISNTETWADQRLRIGGKFSIAEGVSITFRTDVTESIWGSGGVHGSGRAGTVQHWDRAHLDLQKDIFHLRAGQQWVGFGKTGFDAQSNGLLLNVKAPVSVSLFYMLNDNNGSAADTDAVYYGLNVGHKLDSYAANVFFAAQDDNSVAEEVYVVGATFATTIADMVKLYTELEYFFGDASATVDAYGLQAFVDGSVAVADNVTVGGQFFYAMGDKDDAQYVRLGTGFNNWDPIFELGTGLHNESIRASSPYNQFGNGAGIYAGRVYGSIKATDDISFAASAFYGVADEKDVALFKNGYAFGTGMSYAVMANTKLGVQLQYQDYSKENVAADFKAFSAGMGLFVNF